jgi:hypothetical protein
MKRLWLMLTGVIAVSFALLGWVGTGIYQEMPPIPDRVVTTEGKTVIEHGAIAEGQNVWQTMGGGDAAEHLLTRQIRLCECDSRARGISRGRRDLLCCRVNTASGSRDRGRKRTLRVPWPRP